MRKTPNPLKKEDIDLKARVVEALKGVYDPEIPLDVYSLGLIYEITIYPVQNVHILMTLTSPNCPVAGELPEAVRAAAASVEGVKEAHVDLTFDPPFSQEKMSEEAKLALGLL